MPRRAGAPRREVLPDPIFGNVVVTKLVNQVMHDGKKGTAQRVCYEAFDIVRNKTGRDAMEVFEQAVGNIMPVLEVKARRVGGSTYQVPMEVRPVRRQTLGIRWLVSFARNRNERNMSQKLAAEIIDAAAGGGNAVKRKEDTHRMAEANRAFAHYRW